MPLARTFVMPGRFERRVYSPHVHDSLPPHSLFEEDCAVCQKHKEAPVHVDSSYRLTVAVGKMLIACGEWLVMKFGG